MVKIFKKVVEKVENETINRSLHRIQPKLTKLSMYQEVSRATITFVASHNEPYSHARVESPSKDGVWYIKMKIKRAKECNWLAYCQ